MKHLTNDCYQVQQPQVETYLPSELADQFENLGWTFEADVETGFYTITYSEERWEWLTRHYAFPSQICLRDDVIGIPHCCTYQES